MIGAGGVGLAIAFGLKYLGVAELVIYDTVESSMADLVQLMRRHGIQCRATSKQQLIEEMRQAEGLVNATPVGMFQYPGNPFPPEGFVNQKWAFDAVYTPENTPFLQQCRIREIDTLSGFQLFLHQGLDAFQLFTGICPNGNRVESLFLKRYPLEK
jgi:shikimate dehydrogenase